MKFNRVTIFKKLLQVGLISYLVGIFSISQCIALEIGDTEFNFSLSQTYYHTSQNEFLIKDSSDGTFQWTEAMVNTLKSFGQLQLGAQLLIRDFGEEGDFRPDFDWAYLDYAFNNKIGLRLGRVRLPFGLYNEYRDVDQARMEILYPQVFNPEDFRAAAAAYQGLGLYGTFSYDMEGSLQYQVYYGNNYIHDDFFLVRGVSKSFGSPNTEMTTRRLSGLHLIWNMPYEGMRLAYTHLNYKGDFNIEFLHPLAGQISEDRGLNFSIRWNLLSFEYSRDLWKFVFEYLNRDNDNTYSEKLGMLLGTHDADDSNPVSFYTTVSRQLNEDLGVFVSYGELYGNIADDNAPPSKYLKESSFGFRYNIKESLLFKTQLSSMRGNKGALNTNPAVDWFMFSSRVTISF